MKNIVVFGSINTDLVISSNRIPENGETLKGFNFYTSSGGKGANQAVSASKLGGKVTLLGCIGDDSFGENQLKSLQNYGVSTKYIEVIPHTTSGIAIIVKVSGDNRIILNGGANHYLKVDQLKQYIEVEDAENAIFMTQLENDIMETMKALKCAKESGMLTIFNPAPALTLKEVIYQYVDILIINQSEAKILAGIYPNVQSDCEEVYKVFHSLGVKTVVITLGKTGSIILEQGKVYEIKGKKVKTVDSTGAGDAYIGSLAYGLSKGSTVYESALLANKVSAYCVTKDGAQSAMPTLEEVNEMFQEE